MGCGFSRDLFIQKTLHNYTISGDILRDTDGFEIPIDIIIYTLDGIYYKEEFTYFDGLRCKPYMLYKYLP